MSSQSSRYSSALRYPGGKGKVVNFVKMVMLENGLVGRDYVEPYAGGGSVALSLLYDGFADVVHINDINPGVHAFWYSALGQTADFCEAIRATPVTIEEWHRQRAIVLSSSDASSFELGFATFFLNRTNRSGIIGGGVIGGLKQDGPYKINARFTKNELIRRIEKIGRHRSRIELTQLDAVEYLSRWAVPSADPAFLYLDPPYYVKGEGLYDNFYEHHDHVKVADVVHQLVHPWIVSYDAHPEIAKLYEADAHLRYGLSYSASSTRQKGSEVMFFADDLRVPDLLPSQVPTRTVLAAQAAQRDAG